MWDAFKHFFEISFGFILLAGGFLAFLLGVFKTKQSAGQSRFNDALTHWGDGDFSTFLLTPLKTVAWFAFMIGGFVTAALGISILAHPSTPSSAGSEANDSNVTYDYSDINPNPTPSLYPSGSKNENSKNESERAEEPPVSDSNEGGGVVTPSTLSDCERIDNVLQRNECRTKLCQNESNSTLNECEAFKKKVPSGGTPWIQ